MACDAAQVSLITYSATMLKLPLAPPKPPTSIRYGVPAVPLKLKLARLNGHAGPKSSLQPPLRAVSEPQLPMYTCTTVSKSLPQVLIVMVPLKEGVNVYHTPFPIPAQVGVGSPVDVAAAVFTV
jgi:hypothetical protein